MTVLVTKIFEFEAAHKLVDHPGKCKNLHGHTYKLEVTIEGRITPATGMVMDFGDLKKIVQERIIDVVDHTYLNTILDKRGLLDDDPSAMNPTAERLAIWVVGELVDALRDEAVWVNRVKLWETSTSFVEVFA